MVGVESDYGYLNALGERTDWLRALFGEHNNGVGVGKSQQIFRKAALAPGQFGFVLSPAVNNQRVLLLARGQERVHLVRAEFLGDEGVRQPQALEVSAGFGSIDIDRAFAPQAVLARHPGFFPGSSIGSTYPKIGAAKRAFTAAAAGAFGPDRQL